MSDLGNVTRTFRWVPRAARARVWQVMGHEAH